MLRQLADQIELGQLENCKQWFLEDLGVARGGQLAPATTIFVVSTERDLSKVIERLKQEL